MNIATKLSAILTATLMLSSASAVVAKAPHHVVAKAPHHVYVPDRARGAYAAGTQGPFAGGRRYSMPPLNACRLRYGERPEELFQDRGYLEDLGYDC